MKLPVRLWAVFALLLCLPPAFGQLSVPLTVSQIDIKHVGPPAASDELIRANIRVKVGDVYQPIAVDDDVRSLYATGLFYNIRIVTEPLDEAHVKLTYVLQGKPRLTAINFEGNERLKDAKLKKKVTSKVGEPLDERKLFTDARAIRELYEKSGYPGTTVSNYVSIDQNAGRGTATFEIHESPKIKITDVEFIGARAFTQKELRKVIKTKKKWMWSWLTQRGTFKQDQFEEDRETLAQFYRNHGYIDFEIQNVKFEHPTPNTMVIKIYVYEGRQYKVGAVTFKGTTLLPTNAVSPTFDSGPKPGSGSALTQWYAARQLNRQFAMKAGDVFKPSGLSTNNQAIEDFYGAKGYIDVNTSTRNLHVRRVPNTQTGTMDLEYDINEGQPSYVEKIEIRGNTKTKDKVIRRELAISPGEVFDMVRVNVSKKRLEGLNYFEKVDLRPEETEVPNRKNLIVGVDEKSTGNFSLGAGFSSIDSIVAFAEVTQGNFDLFHPPTFTGGGQKFRLRVQLGTQRQDYIATFIEPWFLGRKLQLSIEAYARTLNFQSVHNIYDESRTGVRLGLKRTLGSDFLIGSLTYNIEQAGILLNGGYHGDELTSGTDPGIIGSPVTPSPANVPSAILDEKGYTLLSRISASIAYDTRNSVQLPDGGQRTELTADVAGGPLGGEKDFYKLELKSSWYFRGFFKRHVLEIGGRTGVASGFGGDSVPFYERYYLGGVGSLRGYNYRNVSPREEGFSEPIGGDTYWFGTAEYSLPIIEQGSGVGVRFAIFYDVGAVKRDAYDFDASNYSDNWGVGLRLNLPIGPLRLDYGIPITHDQYNGSSGKFQFNVGYTREY